MNQKLIIAIADFSPLIIKENKTYSGFEIELWEKIVKKWFGENSMMSS